MIKKEKLKEIAKKLSANKLDFMSAFRRNMYLYIDDKDITMNDIADTSGVNLSTLKTFFYGNSRDAKLSNAVKLARAFGVSIDELVGAETIPELSRESLRMCRELPENDLLLVRWFIRYLHQINQGLEPTKRYVSIMLLEPNNNGDFKVDLNYEKLEITELEEPLRSKIFMGFRITEGYYMPHYLPGEAILIANDRPPKPNENVVVRAGKYLFIVKRKIEDGVAKYYSIRDGKYRIDEDDVDELIGYIACKKTM